MENVDMGWRFIRDLAWVKDIAELEEQKRTFIQCSYDANHFPFKKADLVKT